MRQVGTRREPELAAQAQTALLLQGARFSESFAPFVCTGHVPKGVYRFKSHQDSNQSDAEWLAQAIARRAAQQTLDNESVSLEVLRTQRGFTLIELIMVMILISVLAVVVLPRFDSLSTFDATGYSDQLKSVLRFSQKTALAQRRAVMVDFSGATPVLSYAVGSNCTSAGTTLNYPTALRSRGSSTASPTPGGNLTTAWVCFDTLGKPFKTQASPTALTGTGTISITNATTISIESETGYVH